MVLSKILHFTVKMLSIFNRKSYRIIPTEAKFLVETFSPDSFAILFSISRFLNFEKKLITIHLIKLTLRITLFEELILVINRQIASSDEA